MSSQFDCSDSGFTSTLVKDESELVLVSSNVKNEDAFKSNNIHSGRLFTMSSQCDFSDSGFHNTVVKEESELVIIRSNVKNEDDVEKWKNIYCRAFCATFNSARSYDVQKCLLHRRYICIFGDKRHKGKRKTYTG